MKILFAAGGTGGHINPAIAVASEIREKCDDVEILFVGTAEKMESKLVPAAGFDFRPIKISGFLRKISFANFIHNIKTVFYMFQSTIESRRIIKEFKPDIAVGFGGYVSGPVLRKAHKMGVKIAIHEQNAYPGITNKALAKIADAIMLTSPEAEKYMKCRQNPIITGLPVRGEMLRADRSECRKALDLPINMPFVLSMGGSLGARAINEAVAELISLKKDDHDCVFMHAYGQYGSWFPALLAEKGVDADRKDIIIREYIDDMEKVMPAADIVICRAGASSLCETEALGKASILVPSPNVAENHQYKNAMSLVEKNAAVLIEEKGLTGETLRAEVDKLINNPEKRHEIEKNAAAMSISDATERICNVITDLVNG